MKRSRNHKLTVPINAICFYCGERAVSMDHVFPYCVAGILTEAVPSCRECNCVLGCLIFPDRWSKKAHIASRLRQRYADVLLYVDFSESDLSEMGYTLRTEVINGLLLKQNVIERIKFASMTEDDVQQSRFVFQRSYLGGPDDDTDTDF